MCEDRELDTTYYIDLSGYLRISNPIGLGHKHIG
jgi:hypothetical protein